jgi:hypothetical protein
MLWEGCIFAKCTTIMIKLTRTFTTAKFPQETLQDRVPMSRTKLSEKSQTPSHCVTKAP